ncbi:MAG: hypothetical protein WDM87_07940 [Terracidiphilus sp.]
MRQSSRDATESKRITAQLAIPALLIVAPAALFYGCLFSHLINLPFYDDYSALLGFLNQMVQAKGAAAKILLLLAAQNNEYKLFFIHGLGWGQVELFGHVSFVPLCVLGDSSVLILAFLLWSIFLRRKRIWPSGLRFLFPPRGCSSQLGYWETLNWAMALVAEPVGTRILSWDNPVPAATDAQGVRRRAAFVCAGNRGFGQRTSATSGGRADPDDATPARPSYGMASALGGMYRSLRLPLQFDVVTGTVSRLGIFHPGTLSPRLLDRLYWKRGRNRRLITHQRLDVPDVGQHSPAVFRLAGMARICPQKRAGFLFSSFSASYRGWRGRLRSDFGLMQSASSRYAIYGALLVILAWTAVTEEFLLHRSEPLLNNGPYLAMTMAAVLVALWMDEIGYLKLAGREVDAVKWMKAFEHPGSPGSSEGPMAEYPQQSAATVASRQEARVILKESMHARRLRAAQVLTGRNEEILRGKARQLLLERVPAGSPRNRDSA